MIGRGSIGFENTELPVVWKRCCSLEFFGGLFPFTVQQKYRASGGR